MAQVIITVCDKVSVSEFDLEVPNDLEIDKLTDDIIQALEGSNPSLSWNLETAMLFSPKLGRTLMKRKTLREEGIWSGEYLLIQD